MNILKEQKELLQKVIKSDDKDEIYSIIDSIKKYNTSKPFITIVQINLDCKDSLSIEDFRLHSLLTIQQLMIESTGLGLLEIQKRLKVQ